MTEALKEKMRENRDALKDFGALLTTSEHLRETALKAIMSFVPAPVSGKPEPKMRTENRTKAGMDAGKFRAVLEGRVFSINHMKSYPDHAVIIVPKRTIITQLASDEARRRGIRIEIES